METSFDDVVGAVRDGIEMQFSISDEQDWSDRSGADRDYVFEFTTQLLPDSQQRREPRCRATVYTAPDGVEIEVIAAFYDPDYIHSHQLLQLCQQFHAQFEAEFCIIHEYVEHKEKFTVEMRMFHFVNTEEGENFDPQALAAYGSFLHNTVDQLFKK